MHHLRRQSAPGIAPAAIAAGAAIAVVAAAGLAARAPPARVPQNAMKFAVGVMLTSFGIFWGAEGAGAAWPGGDAALLVIVPVLRAISLSFVALIPPWRLWRAPPQAPATAGGGA